jgi:transposase
MFGLSAATRIYIALDAVDMRRGFNGLYGLVRDQLANPTSGPMR